MPGKKGPKTDLTILPQTPRAKKNVPKPKIPKGLGRKTVARRPFGSL